MDEIRVGVIGRGALGRVQAASLSSISGCRLVRDGACDKRVVDAVVIATPTDTHASYVCEALEAGLAVFCEKPLARTLAEAERIRDLADSLGAKVAVGHVVRYFPEYAAARELVARGELGTPISARLARLNSSPADLSGWYAELERSGGVLLDMAIHDIDWCLWTFGPAERVYAVRAGGSGREVASVTIRHRAGTISYIDASWRNHAFATSLEVCGTRGLYRAEGSGSAGFELVEDRRDGAASYLPPPAATTVNDDPFFLELQAAFEWFRGGQPPLATVADACEALRVVEAAEESVGSGAPVAVGEGAA